MKKNRLFGLGIFIPLLTFGLLLAGCNTGGDNFDTYTKNNITMSSWVLEIGCGQGETEIVLREYSDKIKKPER
jgi:hypothetical protein